ncbi:hypothetical protein ACRAWF_27660 [Streptomyces sp. L7]
MRWTNHTIDHTLIRCPRLLSSPAAPPRAACPGTSDPPPGPGPARHLRPRYGTSTPDCPATAPTALTELPSLAVELGVGRVFVRDESARLGLPAFKALGASWAIHRVLARRTGGRPARPGHRDRR